MNFERMNQLTLDLIAINSVTPCEEPKLLFLENILKARGFSVRRLPVAAERFNLLAALGDAKPTLLFNTHIDTVGPRYGPHETTERIYGRGACDTHGILAAMLEAIESLFRDGIRNTGLLVTVDEEGGAHLGARTAGQTLTAPRVLIVGEPTENRLMRSQKGLLKADLEVRGREGHSGYPERADDALRHLCDLIAGLRSQSWLSDHSEQGNTMNVFIAAGGEAYNKVPGYAKAGLFFRLVEPMDVMRSRVERVLGEDARVTLRWLGGNDPLSDLSVLPGWETGVAAYNTDIAHFGWRSTRTYLFGPGSIHQAHRDLLGNDWDGGEWIDKRQQRLGAELYVRLAKQAWAKESASDGQTGL